MAITRGIANKNPGNLRKNDTDKWQGLAAVQNDPSFFVFSDAVYGIRALARTLIAYQDKNGCRNIQDFIGRYAPSSENNTQAYITSVCSSMGIVFPTTTIDMHKYTDLRGLVEAIIHQENGGIWSDYYTDAEMTKAMVLAGVEPARRSLAASGQIIGGAIAAGATVAAPVVQQVQNQLQPLTDYSSYIKSAFIVFTLLGIIIGVITKISERNKGIS